MSTGREHSASTLGLLLGLGVGYPLGYFIDPIQAPIVVAGSALSGFLVGSDLDVDTGNISNHYIRKAFGTDLLWNVFWRPYRMGKKHRGLSHVPILGTLFRILYILCPPVIIIFSDQKTSKVNLFFSSLVSSLFSVVIWVSGVLTILIGYPEYVLSFVLGMVFGDLLHILMDWLF